MTSLRDANLNAKPVTNELFKRSLYAISRSRSSNIVGKPNISNKASLVSDTITGTQTASNTTTKVYHHPWEERTVLSDVYESPITDREHWWRAELKVTPSPGAYDTNDFLSELAKKPRTYAFRDQGRKAFHTVDPGKGALLLPGAYKCTDFLENLTKKPATYRFKAESRDAKDYLNFGIKDKAINVPPNAYLVEGYLAVNGEKAPVKNYMFKSQTKRFPTFIFRPKEGPSPDAYNVKDTAPKMPAVTSCFRSKTPRFHSVHSRVPDPGLYAKTFQHPMPNTISQLGRQHGLFFTSEFQI
ncbi:protein STPG4-like isoform X2 [Biomphalaria pfeifferi]|uniref:Protein STPG4-like isoform X2 n=1 Tax=Biomphalaria pfeifferi TaxID=112525 RepID=A0AAD8FCW5_BIOPF|nr:protein STPG4-like isoform X2 [Biomphalaria pfeifferi]